MAKRISSIFSMSSNYSEQSSDSRHGSSLHPARPSKEQGSIASDRKSMPNLRPNSDLQDSHYTQPPESAPPLNPTFVSRIQGSTPRLQPPHDHTSLPTGSRSRPSSIASMFSTTSELLLPPSPLLKPLPAPSGSPSGSRPVSSGSRTESLTGSRPPSRPVSRPDSPNTRRPQTPINDQRLAKKRSWLPGKFYTVSQCGEQISQAQQAWIVTPQQKLPYDVSALASFHPVPELWSESGDTLIYLHTRECGRGPSFKVNSSILASSKKLINAAHGGTQHNGRRESIDWQQRSFSDRMQHLTVNGPTSPPSSRPGSIHGGSSQGSRSLGDHLDDPSIRLDIHLCLPLPLQFDLSDAQARPNAEDVETLLTMRNVFAFLLGQPLVATNRQSSMFTVFLKIADVLQRYEFTNLDGSTLGEEASGSFATYCQDYNFADVRASREKSIEAVVLGERMRSWDLYNEGFVHVVGKYDDVWALKSPKFHLITDATRKRMERAHLDLSSRLRNVRTRLDDFDFPSLFAGFAKSTTSSESKVIRFKDWKSSYISMRRHVMNFYKHQYGAWPPKAKSKKNNFEESGLNRLLLQELYRDFSDLYDVLVDRSSLTHRSTGLTSPGGSDGTPEPMSLALRRILDEYDLSTAPVQPPIPFDIPRLPSLSTTRRGFDALDAQKRRKERSKRLPDDEINNALLQSCNRDSLKSTPFLEAFLAFERRSTHGKSIVEICDLRIGQWILMYAVIQSLPLVVVDAPGIKWSQGVEYFLCQVPKGSAPWIIAESSSSKQSWYGIAGGSGLVSLPADVVEHGVDGIYRRSHCWLAAENWAGQDAIANLPEHGLPFDELLPPKMPSQPGSRSTSPTPDRKRASMALGLEQLPLPPGVAPSGARPVSIHDPTKTFGAILAQTNTGGKKK